MKKLIGLLSIMFTLVVFASCDSIMTTTTTTGTTTTTTTVTTTTTTVGTTAVNTTISTNVEILGIVISSENNVRNIKQEETLALSATVYPENANQEVIWSSLNPEIATVSETGVVTAIEAGTATIKATSKANVNVESVVPKNCNVGV